MVAVGDGIVLLHDFCVELASFLEEFNVCLFLCAVVFCIWQCDLHGLFVFLFFVVDRMGTPNLQATRFGDTVLLTIS